MNSYTCSEGTPTKRPKEFNHWLKLNGIKPVDRTDSGKYYFKDKERHYRITCFGEFEASESFETFDRWANSRLVAHPRIPQSKQELDAFLALVQQAQEQFLTQQAIEKIVFI